jgi:hypothetical protein
MSKADAQQLVTVKLLKPHTHADVQMETGDTLDLLPDQAQWLKAEGVAEILPTATTK